MDQQEEHNQQPQQEQPLKEEPIHHPEDHINQRPESSVSNSDSKESQRRMSDHSSSSYSGSDNEYDKLKQGEKKQVHKKIRYKYCCKICKHTDSNKKACVCVVPLNQRRTEIGTRGCQTCGCNGCSKEDFISRGEDPEYHPGEKKKVRRQKQPPQFEARNGCCRNCMKAFSKTNKSCLCQVPQNVRNTKLPSSGCKICGCFGCNPEDKKEKEGKGGRKMKRQRSKSRDKKKKRRRSRSSSSNSREYIDSMAMNFNNIDRSPIGAMMVNQYRIDPALLGFGVPQRSYSYLTGKPK